MGLLNFGHYIETLLTHNDIQISIFRCILAPQWKCFSVFSSTCLSVCRSISISNKLQKWQFVPRTSNKDAFYYTCPSPAYLFTSERLTLWNNNKKIFSVVFASTHRICVVDTFTVIFLWYKIHQSTYLDLENQWSFFPFGF